MFDSCNVCFHVVAGDNVLPYRCALPLGHLGAHRNTEADPSETSWPGYPRGVELGRGIVAQVAIVEPAADEYAILIAGPHRSHTLDVVFINDDDDDSPASSETARGGYLGVEEHALVDALTAALQIGALAVKLPFTAATEALQRDVLADDRNTDGPRCDAAKAGDSIVCCARPAGHAGVHCSHAGLVWGGRP